MNFKNKEIKEMHEYNKLRVFGYKELFNLFEAIPEEKRNEYNNDLMKIQSILVKNYNLNNKINKRKERIKNLIKEKAPIIIINNEYRLFFEDYYNGEYYE